MEETDAPKDFFDGDGLSAAGGDGGVCAATRKPGLWELTTVMTMEAVPPGGANGVPHVAQVCFAQEMIDKYGAIVPTMPGCKLASYSVKPGHMTGSMVCSGRMLGTAEAESSWRIRSTRRGAFASRELWAIGR